MKQLMLVSALLMPAWNAALAQENRDLRVRVGLGAQLLPEYVGADKEQVAPFFDIDFARGDHQFKFEAPDDNFGISVVDSGGFSFGPAASIQSSRKDKDVGAAVGKVKTTFEVGAFAQYEANDSWRVRADLLQGVNGHKGLVGSIGADKIWRDGDKYVFSVGPRVMFSDAKYQRAYFGVTPVTSVTSGLPVYRPSGGVHALAIASGLSTQFNDRFGLFGYARYERLVGDAAKSPIVRVYGSRNQFSGGLGLNYTFKVKR